MDIKDMKPKIIYKYNKNEKHVIYIIVGSNFYK